MTTTTTTTTTAPRAIMHLATDPDWYRAGCRFAGVKIGETYRINDKRFLTVAQGNAKLAKSDKRSDRYLSAILHLAPHAMSGVNVCPNAGACAAVCVAYNGHGMLPNTAFDGATAEGKLSALVGQALSAVGNVHRARIAKTRLLFQDRDTFKRVLFDDVARFERKSRRNGRRALIRLNGTSDLAWELLFADLFEAFPRVQFYDYTKRYPRMRRYLEGRFPDNYDLTFSRDEQNDKQARDILERGGRVAVVIRTRAMKTAAGGRLAHLGHTAILRARYGGIPGFEGFRVVSGDDSDLRHLDPQGAVVALYAKNKAARDDSGFVVTID